MLIAISHSLEPLSGVAPPPANWSTVSGISSSDEAKIGGMTPAVLSLSGRWLRSCCIMPRAVWRLGYWIRTRRWARSMKQMNMTSATTAMTMPNTTIGSIVPVRPPSNSWASDRGSEATIPAMMISDTPLPMPRLVICSPIHIRNSVPPTRLMVAATRNSMPGSTTAEMPCVAARPSRPTAMK